MVVKTFRGLMADGGQDRIRLSTIKGKMGYRIVKFQVMGQDSSTSYEAVCKIFKETQTSVTTTINFTDTTLLAAAIYQQNATGQTYPVDQVTIFDNEIFNQDIFITYTTSYASGTLNYYIELEVIPLDDKGAEYTTVKDLRTRGF